LPKNNQKDTIFLEKSKNIFKPSGRPCVQPLLCNKLISIILIRFKVHPTTVRVTRHSHHHRTGRLSR
jgi:hypothetical protein